MTMCISRNSNPVVAVGLAPPAPTDCMQATPGKRVAIGAPDNARLVAIQKEANEMRREPMTPRGPGGVDVQAVHARWQQLVSRSLLVEPVATECKQPLARLLGFIGLLLMIEAAQPVNRP